MGYSYRRVRLSLKNRRDQALFEIEHAELQQLKELHSKGEIDLYHCDESHFGLTPNVCYAWRHKERPTLLPAAKGRRLSVFGLMTPDCRLVSWVAEWSMDSGVTSAMLDEFADRLTRKTVVVLDNAPTRTGRAVKF